MKYYNEMELRIINTPANEEFAKRVIIDFLKPTNTAEEGLKVAVKMLEEVMEAVKIKNGQGIYRIRIRAKMTGRNFDIEAVKLDEW